MQATLTSTNESVTAIENCTLHLPPIKPAYFRNKDKYNELICHLWVSLMVHIVQAATYL